MDCDPLPNIFNREVVFQQSYGAMLRKKDLSLELVAWLVVNRVFAPSSTSSINNPNPIGFRAFKSCNFWLHLLYIKSVRKGRDSNPRSVFTNAALAERWFQPLTHPSSWGAPLTPYKNPIICLYLWVLSGARLYHKPYTYIDKWKENYFPVEP